MTFWLSRSRPCAVMVVALLSLLPTTCAVGQAPERSLGDLVHELADKEIDRYKITLQDSGVVLTRVPHSILRWSNTTRNSAFGDTYIWTDAGCARAILSLFAIAAPRKSFAAECQSLSESPFTMRRDDIVVWSTSKPGVAFQKVEGVRPPAGTAASRLVQMNAIARRFRADFAPHTTPDDFTQLRLLSKPLFRYDSKKEDIVDGAVYGFVDATDPELLLVIEARRNGQETSWVYSPARSRHDHLRLYLGGKVVWEGPRLSPPWENIRDPSQPYFNLRLEKILPPDQWQQIAEIFDR